MSVDRCVCHDTTLRAMLPIIESLRDRGVTDEDKLVDALASATGCTTGCGMCEPYVRATIRTGRTSFPVAPAPTRA